MASAFSSSVVPLAVAAGIALVGTPTPAQAVVQAEGAAVTVTPGGSVIPTGLRVAVVSATDTAGDVLTAQRALVAANTAVARTHGFASVPQAEVARAMTTVKQKRAIDYRTPHQPGGTIDRNVPFGEPAVADTRLPVDTTDYKNIGKALKVERVMSVIVSRGEASDAGATVSAVVELFETKTGGLIGRGEGTFSATVDEAAATAPTGAPVPNAGDAPVVNGVARTAVTTGEVAQVRALGGAIFRAVADLNRPAETRGVVISLPEAYKARISVGSRSGLRSGARLEYLINGQPVAYGTVTNVGMGEAVATVAPEAAFPNVYINMEVRNVSNPVIARMGKDTSAKNEQEFRRFETEFGVALGIAGLLYGAGIFDDLDKRLPVR